MHIADIFLLALILLLCFCAGISFAINPSSEALFVFLILAVANTYLLLAEG